ncbi:MAG: GntR family transcriptional regulator [Pedococcus sp.]
MSTPRRGQSATPSKYEQLASTLEARIAPMTPHAALPTERELMEDFSMSRSTVRQAIRVLLGRGLVYNVQGSGTYVSDPEVVSKTLRLTGFTEDMRQRGLEPSSRVISSDCVPAPPELASTLQVTPGAPLRMLRRLRLADGVPMALETIYLVSELLGTSDVDFDRSIYEQLADAGVVVDRAAQTIRAVNLDVDQARLLDQAVGAAAIQVSRVTYTDRGQPFEQAVTTYRGDRYSFQIGVGRSS